MDMAFEYGIDGAKKSLEEYLKSMTCIGIASYGYIVKGVVAWDQLLAEDEQSKRLALETGLKEYCKLDTLAMVRLFQHLQDHV